MDEFLDFFEAEFEGKLEAKLEAKLEGKLEGKLEASFWVFPFGHALRGALGRAPLPCVEWKY